MIDITNDIVDNINPNLDLISFTFSFLAILENTIPNILISIFPKLIIEIQPKINPRYNKDI